MLDSVHTIFLPIYLSLHLPLYLPIYLYVFCISLHVTFFYISFPGEGFFMNNERCVTSGLKVGGHSLNFFSSNLFVCCQLFVFLMFLTTFIFLFVFASSFLDFHGCYPHIVSHLYTSFLSFFFFWFSLLNCLFSILFVFLIYVLSSFVFFS